MALEKQIMEEDPLRQIVEDLGGEIVEGFLSAIYQDWTAHLHVDHLVKLIELVRQDEREACAKVCEQLSWPCDIDEWCQMGKREVSARSGRECAAAIRARGIRDV